MSRITLITFFNDCDLKKIDKLIENIDFPICKVPYGIDDNNRYIIDNLPYHLTVFATDKINQSKVIDLANNLDFNNFSIKVNSLKTMAGRNNSVVLYLGIEDNEKIRRLQQVFYKAIPEEKYNPQNFTFHITLCIDQDKNKIANLYKQINSAFEPFLLKIDKLALYDYPGEKLEEFAIKPM